VRTERALLVLAFFATRLVLAWMADGLTPYPEEWIDGDVYLYAEDASAVLDGAVPYSDVELEYPPGALPSIVVPGLLAERVAYRTAFIAFSLIVDAVGFSVLLALRRRWGGIAGAWIWVASVPLLGPIVYLRFDLVPAVATILALERVAAGALARGGGWLGFGTVAKIYPGMLVLPVFAATRRVRLLVGAVAGALVPVLLLVSYGGPATVVALVTDVLGYHAARGIQVESTWSTTLLAAGRLGLVDDVSTSYSFMAHHVEAPIAPLVETIAALAALVALVAGTWLAWRAADRVDPERAAALGAFATLALLLATGSVYSTQYTLWLVALGAVVACLADNPLRGPVALLPLVALLSQLGYPFRYAGLLDAAPRSIVVVGGRNLLVILCAVWSAGIILRLPRRRSRQEERDEIPVLEVVGPARGQREDR
jgi:Glycosyltransferase family 87